MISIGPRKLLESHQNYIKKKTCGRLMYLHFFRRPKKNIRMKKGILVTTYV